MRKRRRERETERGKKDIAVDLAGESFFENFCWD
jgi:hypothetical protein